MKKLFSLIIAATLLLSLCSCGGYVSSYKAIGLVRSQTKHGCETSFYSLKGQLVFKLKKSSGSEGSISFSVRADEGEIYLYYDNNGSKQQLAHVKAGESITDKGGYVEGGNDVYIIIEAPNGAGGKVSVELNGELSTEK